MSQEIAPRSQGIYYTVIDGTFRTRVDKDYPGAKVREYETESGATAIKYERIVGALSGFIVDISIVDGKFGKEINITLDPNAEGRNPVLQLSTESSYGEDFLKKLPSINFSKQLTIKPYAFTDAKDKEREIRGVTVEQAGEDGRPVKILNFFFDPVSNQVTHNFPVAKYSKEDMTTDLWKIHFIEVRMFLVQYASEKVIATLKEKRAAAEAAGLHPASADGEINAGDIPF